ncbi:peritrophin-48 [Drosophila takahashii]|uniref:peritrophin-48 n=1 Tax=Drosophila takahashii TaxID=29030 RepID=UPI001CF90F28|nr:peritrophin-48 [Drosophila takahashii]
MTGKFLLATTILCLMGGSALGDAILEGTYNVTAFCTACKTGIQLGSIESCQKYYVCQSTGPVVAECQSGYSYDYKKSTCLPSSQVNCYYGVDNPCAGKNGTWVPNTGVCGGYYYCELGVSKAGSCSKNQVFNSVTAECEWGSCATTQTTEGAVLNSLCEVVPPNQYFGDTNDCATWNYCVSNSTGVYAFSGKCASTTTKQNAFNVKTGSCDYTSDSICSRVTDIPLSSAAVSCPKDGVKEGSATVCGTYNVCTNGKWVATNCPTGYYFDTLTSNCVVRQSATPTAGCNRCQGASTKFVNAVNSENCSTYYYCNAQGQATLNTCPTAYFFNEKLGACKPEDDLAAYVPSNGACYGSKASSTTEDGTEAETTADPSGKMFDLEE